MELDEEFIPIDQTSTGQSLENRVTGVEDRVEDIEERIRGVGDQIESAGQGSAQKEDPPNSWSSDVDGSNQALRQVKDEVNASMLSMAKGTAKAMAKLIKMIPKVSKVKAEKVKEDLKKLLHTKIENTSIFLQERL
ncbi:hypothetical protein Pst134EA_002930 [Puccinia striiformis f. sp. tritici]|uniref:hypothetical protein n=1 Tax=Puccinia striiformis f. sp. tritici TaxID=168172 RepID=UPI00200897DF|nr:hypothetical protein Pst134EA_002930 [Puccinia striiformis f. sp. tritici]KAH9464474.1 hypothetical protein Pst134EB_004008 [Puccinia striiformis f. sp. tritici]KAH9472307.1 hypothetical protein Pst134EA_002930 [Puccinia striiformis f. sp. tritici]